MDKDIFLKVCNLYFVKYFHKIGTILGPGRKIIPSRRTDDISTVAPKYNFFSPHPEFSSPHPEFSSPHPEFSSPYPEFSSPHSTDVLRSSPDGPYVRTKSGDQGLSLCLHGEEPGNSDAVRALLSGPRSRAEHRRKVNNQGFGVCFCYKRLNLVISDSDFVILGFHFLIQSSDSVNK